MNTEPNFEIAPFEWTAGVRGEREIPAFDAELGDLETGEEFERGGRPSVRARGSVPASRRFAAPSRSKPAAPGPVRSGGSRMSPPMRPPRPKPRPRPSHTGSWGPVGVLVRDSYRSVSEPFPGDSMSSAPGTEIVRWAQDCLNHAMGLRLAVNGVMGADTRSALRRFQGQQRLRVSGILGPDTKKALTGACKGELSPEFVRKDITDELQTDRPIRAAEDKEDFSNIFGRIDSEHDQEINKVNGVDGARIIDLTAKADKSVRKGMRDPKSVYALVLHQMACCFKPKDPLKRFLSLGAHFAILADGRILQLHPISALVWASNGFNNRSVAVEFAGNFPSIKGKWWKGDTYGRNYPTQAQIEAGRTLVRYLINKIGLTRMALT